MATRKKQSKKAKTSRKNEASGRAKFSAHKKNLDNMELLVSDPKFQHIVAETRKKLGIHEGGFTGPGREQRVKAWTKKLDVESDEILTSKDFIRKEKQIREKLKNKEVVPRGAQTQFSILTRDIPWNYLRDRIEYIITKFYIPVHYTTAIRQYILYENIIAPPNNFDVTFLPKNKKISEATHIAINVYAKLTKKELQEVKKEIELVGKMLPKFKPLKNIKSSIEIEQQVSRREYYDPVKEKTLKIPTQAIAKEFFGDKQKVKQVHDKVRAFKEARKQRFKKP